MQYILFVLMFIGATVAVPAAETVPASSATARQQIIAALTAWRDAANAGKRETSLGFYTSDAISDFPPRPVVTFAEMQRRLANPPSALWNTEFKILEVFADGALGVVRVEFTSREVQPNGTLGRGETILTTQVWRKESDGQWRIAKRVAVRELTHVVPADQKLVIPPDRDGRRGRRDRTDAAYDLPPSLASAPSVPAPDSGEAGRRSGGQTGEVT